MLSSTAYAWGKKKNSYTLGELNDVQEIYVQQSYSVENAWDIEFLYTWGNKQYAEKLCATNLLCRKCKHNTHCVSVLLPTIGGGI